MSAGDEYPLVHTGRLPDKHVASMDELRAGTYPEGSIAIQSSRGVDVWLPDDDAHGAIESAAQDAVYEVLLGEGIGGRKSRLLSTLAGARVATAVLAILKG